MIVRRGRKWVLLSEKTGKVLGKHDTREEAETQELAIQIREKKARLSALRTLREQAIEEFCGGEEGEEAHSKADVTEIYAQRDIKRALEVAQKIG